MLVSTQSGRRSMYTGSKLVELDPRGVISVRKTNARLLKAWYLATAMTDSCLVFALADYALH